MNLASFKNSRTARRLFLAVAIVGAVGFIAGPMLRGRGQRARAAPATTEQLKEQAKLQQEAAGLRQKLDAAQQITLSKNPGLVTRQRELVGVIDGKLKAAGTDPAQIESSMKKLQARIQDTKLSEPERKKAVSEAMALMRKFEAARGKVLTEPAVASKVKSFRTDLLAAMKKVDPSIAKVIQKLEQTEAKLEAFEPPT